jgi:SAM-dependent methyltransferase
MDQKKVFLNEQGDSWFLRNKRTLEQRDYKDDSLKNFINIILLSGYKVKNLLEIGCGGGYRLKSLMEEYEIKTFGIDPSAAAIETAKSFGVEAKVGTADRLEYPDNFFDVVVFGGVLCWCDPKDLFLISAETHRTLKSEAWIIIGDFYSSHFDKVSNKHKDGLFTYKMNYSTMFEWHPDYTIFNHSVFQYSNAPKLTDDNNNWVASTLIRKRSLDF